MQLMSSRGLEKTTTQGFGWIKGDVIEMTPSDPDLKIPQIGWNTLDSSPTASRCLTASRPGRTGCMPISCIPTILPCENPDELVATTDPMAAR